MNAMVVKVLRVAFVPHISEARTMAAGAWFASVCNEDGRFLPSLIDQPEPSHRPTGVDNASPVNPSFSNSIASGRGGHRRIVHQGLFHVADRRCQPADDLPHHERFVAWEIGWQFCGPELDIGKETQVLELVFSEDDWFQKDE